MLNDDINFKIANRFKGKIAVKWIFTRKIFHAHETIPGPGSKGNILKPVHSPIINVYDDNLSFDLLVFMNDHSAEKAVQRLFQLENIFSDVPGLIWEVQVWNIVAFGIIMTDLFSYHWKPSII